VISITTVASLIWSLKVSAYAFAFRWYISQPAVAYLVSCRYGSKLYDFNKFSSVAFQLNIKSGWLLNVKNICISCGYSVLCQTGLDHDTLYISNRQNNLASNQRTLLVLFIPRTTWSCKRKGLGQNVWDKWQLVMIDCKNIVLH